MITASAIQSAITPADWEALRPFFGPRHLHLLVLLLDLFLPSGVRRLWCIAVAIAGVASAGSFLVRNYHTPYSAFGGAFLSRRFLHRLSSSYLTCNSFFTLARLHV